MSPQDAAEIMVYANAFCVLANLALFILTKRNSWIGLAAFNLVSAIMAAYAFGALQ